MLKHSLFLMLSVLQFLLKDPLFSISVVGPSNQPTLRRYLIYVCSKLCDLTTASNVSNLSIYFGAKVISL